ERFHPRRLLQGLQRHGPELLQQLPALPQRLNQLLTQLEKSPATATAGHARPPEAARGLAGAAALCLGAGAGILATGAALAGTATIPTALPLAGAGLIVTGLSLSLRRGSWNNGANRP